MRSSSLMSHVFGLVCLSASAMAFTAPTFVSRRPPMQQAVPSSNAVIQLQQRLQLQPRGQRSSLLFMGWGPDPIWSDAKITSNAHACESGVSVVLTVDVPPETASAYAIPGQYVQVRASGQDEKPLFLAIASPPDQENAQFTFLVKKADANDWLTSATSGVGIQISQVLGNGYPVEEHIEGFKYDFPTQNILLFAAGSGIAPIKAAMESGELVKDGRTCRLYYGERTAKDLCFVDQFSAWEKAGIEVVPVLSQPDDSWQGRTGYVQNALEEDGIPIPRNSGALVCGMKGMAEAVKDLLVQAGMFEGRVLFNY